MYKPYWTPGNRQAREATGPFLFWHSVSAAILYFRTLCALPRSRSTPSTRCLLRCCHAEAYLGASITVPCATDRSIGLPEFYVTHTSLSDGHGFDHSSLNCSRKFAVYKTFKVWRIRVCPISLMSRHDLHVFIHGHCQYKLHVAECVYRGRGEFRWESENPFSQGFSLVELQESISILLK